MQNEKNTSASNQFQSKLINVKGSKMHYLEIGQGDPVVFIHGIPTSSYLWRKVMPQLADNARCIAVDLIGMGASDKPDIDYRIFDHCDYFDGFMEAMKLKNVTLVLHGWGSVVGFHYAEHHAKNIRALAFYESHVRPTTDWNMLSLPVQQFASLLNRPGASYRAIVQQNYLIKKLLPAGIVRPLTEEELAEYEKPFPTPESRKPLWQYVQDLPLGKGPSDVVDLLESYSQWLQKSDVPKLMLYAIPGFITTVDTVQWARDHIKNIEIAGLDDALHFAQESIPELFGQALRDWYLKLKE